MGKSQDSRLGNDIVSTYCEHSDPPDVGQVQFAVVGDVSHTVTVTQPNANVGNMQFYLKRSPVD